MKEVRKTSQFKKDYKRLRHGGIRGEDRLCRERYG